MSAAPVAPPGSPPPPGRGGSPHFENRCSRRQRTLCLLEALSPWGHCASPIHRAVIYTFIGSHLVLIKSSTHQFVRAAQPRRSAESSFFKSQLIVPPPLGGAEGAGRRGLWGPHICPFVSSGCDPGATRLKRSIQLERWPSKGIFEFPFKRQWYPIIMRIWLDGGERRGAEGWNELARHFSVNPILPEKKGDYTAHCDGKWGFKFIHKL